MGETISVAAYKMTLRPTANPMTARATGYKCEKRIPRARANAGSSNGSRFIGGRAVKFTSLYRSGRVEVLLSTWEIYIRRCRCGKIYLTRDEGTLILGLGLLVFLVCRHGR